MAQCKQCGAQLADNAKFCTSCGTKVEAAPAPQPKPQQPQPMQAQQPKPQMPPMQSPQQMQQPPQQQINGQQMPPQGQYQQQQFNQQGQGQQFGQQFQQFTQQAQQQYKQNNAQYPSMPVEQNSKVIAILMYIFPILFFIPLLQNPKEQFSMFHANQVLILFIMSIASYIIAILPIIGWIATFVIGIFSLLCKILGIIAVVNGQFKPLPIIGKFQIIK